MIGSKIGEKLSILGGVIKIKEKENEKVKNSSILFRVNWNIYKFIWCQNG